MTAVVHVAALVTTAFGLVAAAVVLAAARSARAAMAVLLDFLTAAGLLRLVGEPTWDALAAAAAVVAVRKLVVAGLYAWWPR